MLGLRKKVSDTTLVTLANLASAGFGFITFFILIRSLELSQFGEWVLYVTAFNLAEMIRTGLVRQAMVHSASSANSADKKRAVQSSAFYLSLVLSIVSGIVLFAIGQIFYAESTSGIAYFFLVYPLAGLLSLIPSFDTWLAQAQGKMLRMSLFTLIPAFFLAVFALISFWYQVSLLELIVVHTAIRAVLAVYAFASSPSSRSAIIQPVLGEIGALWNYGKFSVATLLGTNLLKSADNFLIAYFLGPAAVAIYNVPLKLLEIAEIPARSTGQVLFPKLSRLFSENDLKAFGLTLKKNITRLFIGYIPAAVIAFIGADYLVSLVGGDEVVGSAIVLRIFLVYVILLPIDRLLGVAIDSTGRPVNNAIKVWIMVGLNVIGDVLVLYYFSSLAMVALVTVVNILAGILVGGYLLKKPLGSLKPYITLKNSKNAIAA